MNTHFKKTKGKMVKDIIKKYELYKVFNSLHISIKDKPKNIGFT